MLPAWCLVCDSDGASYSLFYDVMVSSPGGGKAQRVAEHLRRRLEGVLAVTLRTKESYPRDLCSMCEKQLCEIETRVRKFRNNFAETTARYDKQEVSQTKDVNVARTAHNTTEARSMPQLVTSQELAARNKTDGIGTDRTLVHQAPQQQHQMQCHQATVSAPIPKCNQKTCLEAGTEQGHSWKVQAKSLQNITGHTKELSVSSVQNASSFNGSKLPALLKHVTISNQHHHQQQVGLHDKHLNCTQKMEGELFSSNEKSCLPEGEYYDKLQTGSLVAHGSEKKYGTPSQLRLFMPDKSFAEPFTERQHASAKSPRVVKTLSAVPPTSEVVTCRQGFPGNKQTNYDLVYNDNSQGQCEASALDMSLIVRSSLQESVLDLTTVSRSKQQHDNNSHIDDRQHKQDKPTNCLYQNHEFKMSINSGQINRSAVDQQLSGCSTESQEVTRPPQTMSPQQPNNAERGSARVRGPPPLIQFFKIKQEAIDFDSPAVVTSVNNQYPDIPMMQQAAIPHNNPTDTHATIDKSFHDEGFDEPAHKRKKYLVREGDVPVINTHISATVNVNDMPRPGADGDHLIQTTTIQGSMHIPLGRLKQSHQASTSVSMVNKTSSHLNLPSAAQSLSSLASADIRPNHAKLCHTGMPSNVNRGNIVTSVSETVSPTEPYPLYSTGYHIMKDGNLSANSSQREPVPRIEVGSGDNDRMINSLPQVMGMGQSEQKGKFASNWSDAKISTASENVAITTHSGARPILNQLSSQLRKVVSLNNSSNFVRNLPLCHANQQLNAVAVCVPAHDPKIHCPDSENGHMEASRGGKCSNQPEGDNSLTFQKEYESDDYDDGDTETTSAGKTSGKSDQSGRRQLLRPWLEERLDRGNIAGFRWWDKEKNLFKIPWKHRSKNDWHPDNCTIFMEWAIHTGKYRVGIDKLDYCRWKTRLRCAFNQAIDIRERKDLGQLKSEDPYKVYEFMPKSEIKAAKELRQKAESHRMSNAGICLQQQSKASPSEASSTQGPFKFAIPVVELPKQTGPTTSSGGGKWTPAKHDKSNGNEFSASNISAWVLSVDKPPQLYKKNSTGFPDSTRELAVGKGNDRSKLPMEMNNNKVVCDVANVSRKNDINDGDDVDIDVDVDVDDEQSLVIDLGQSEATALDASKVSPNGVYNSVIMEALRQQQCSCISSPNKITQVDSYICDICGESFKSDKLFNEHRLSKHRLVNQKEEKSDVDGEVKCNKMFFIKGNPSSSTTESIEASNVSNFKACESNMAVIIKPIAVGESLFSVEATNNRCDNGEVSLGSGRWRESEYGKVEDEVKNLMQVKQTVR